MPNKVNFDDLENVLPNTVMIGGTEYVVTYTGDREDLEQQAWYNDWVYHVLINHHPALDRSSEMPFITQKFIDCVRFDGFINLQIEGYSNSGKSWWAFARAIELLEWWSFKGVYGIIWLAQSKSKVLRLVKSSKTGDIMFCDEETKNTGQESKQDETAIENILDACRINGVSFFFLDPESEPKPNVHAKVRIVSLARDAFYTFSLVYTPKGRLKGFDDTLIPARGFENEKYDTKNFNIPVAITDGETLEVCNNWDDLMGYYLPRKKGYVTELLINEGIKGTGIDKRLDEHAAILYDYACEQNLKINKMQLRTWIPRVKMEGLTKDYKEQVIQRVMNRVAIEGTKTRYTGHDDELNVTWKIQETNNERLNENFIVNLHPYLEKERVKYNKSQTAKGIRGGHIRKHHIDWFDLWCGGDSQAEIGESASPPVSQAIVSNATKLLRAKILGYAVEEWVHNAHPDWVYVGGNSDEPDFETPDTVISVKGRCRDNIQISWKDFGKKERERHLFEGKRLIMHYFEMKFKKRFIIFEATIVSDKIDVSDE